jgi:hypothetical protein
LLIKPVPPKTERNLGKKGIIRRDKKDMINPKNIIMILTLPFLLAMVLAGLLFAEAEKALPTPLPDTQKECDQKEMEATPSDSFIASPMAPSQGKTETPNLLTPPQFFNQQGTKTKV